MRLKIRITGLIQGVGFRPFVYRIAELLGLHGFVVNDTSGVVIEVEGQKDKLDTFLVRLEKEKPHIAKIFSLEHAYLEDKGFELFEIRESSEKGLKRASILPDISVCGECLTEVTDPKDRRFLYPFINCTNCGPRFTIMQSLPYDRNNTSLKSFRMCQNCEEEYSAPDNRRFHAQPDACHACGPWISLHDCNGQLMLEKEEALEKGVSLIRKGYILAVKGLGGFHLLCDATNEQTVKRLRLRKQREEKPMAVMFSDLAGIRDHAYVSVLEERAIISIEKPIVIVNRNGRQILAEAIAPDNTTIGVFLPYTPLHYLMLKRLKTPVIATSANITDEPIVMDESDAFSRLSKIADYYLIHNRDIVRRCDDSVVRVVAERQVPIRRSRGFSPLPVMLPCKLRKTVLALGPFMNNTIAVGFDNKVYISQHIGDLETPLAVDFFKETVKDFLTLFDITPDIVIADLHPGYYSTKYGEKHFPDILFRVQHHYAHVLSCMTDNEMPEDARVIGFAYDGTGYGSDKTIWGSEVLIASYRDFTRRLHLAPFRLPGGDKAVKEPCRTALSLLYATYRDMASTFPFLPFNVKEREFFIHMMKHDVHSPLTTSMGRLFDGVASLINLNHTITYHSQAAVSLEQAALKSDTSESYPFFLKDAMIHYAPMIKEIVHDLQHDTLPEIIARKFHNTIIDIILSSAELLRDETRISHVVLSGGVFQNAILLENVFNRLQEKKFIPLIHQRVPTNDGGISLGQAMLGMFL